MYFLWTNCVCFTGSLQECIPFAIWEIPVLESLDERDSTDKGEQKDKMEYMEQGARKQEIWET